MVKPSQAEINALINLLDDPDAEVFREVKTKLLSFGEDVIPALENFWEHNSFGVHFQTRIEDLIHEIQFDGLKFRLQEWLRHGANDLLEGACIVARYQYPDLDEQSVYQKVDQLERDIWLEMNNNLTSLETVNVFNHILFDVHNFTGNKKNFHSPQNSFINNVLESHKGNPLTLSLLYIVLAQRLSVPIYGVNLPNHFVLCYVDENNLGPMFIDKSDSADTDVLFYINPFSRGTIFNHKEIDSFLKELNIEPAEEYYSPCNNIAIIKRMLTNLVYSYQKSGYEDKVEELTRLLTAFD